MEEISRHNYVNCGIPPTRYLLFVTAVSRNATDELSRFVTSHFVYLLLQSIEKKDAKYLLQYNNLHRRWYCAILFIVTKELTIVDLV